MRVAIHRLRLAALVILFGGSGACAAGIDPDFAPNFLGPASAREIRSVADGSLFLVGPFDSIGTTRLNGVARLRADNTVDPNFAPVLSPLQTAPYADRVMSMADGRVMITGNFGGFGSATTNYAVVLNADGSVSQTFSAARTDDAVIHYFPLASGKFLASDERVDFTNPQVYGLVRLNANGSLDASFSSSAQYVTRIVEEPGGSVIIASGDLPNYGTTRVKRILANGMGDPSFVESSYRGLVNVLVRQADGKILVGGNIDRGVRRLNSDGTEDAAFTAALGVPGADPSGGMIDGGVRDISIEPDGHILLAGAFSMNSPVFATGFVRLSPDGTPVTGGYMYSGSVNGVVRSAFGYTVVGDFYEFLGARRIGAARIAYDGTLDPDFHPVLSSARNAQVGRFSQLSDERLLVTGNFQVINGTLVDSFARLMPDGTLDSTFQPPDDLTGKVGQAIALADGRCLIVGNFTTVGGLPRPSLARLLENGSVDPTFDAAVGDPGVFQIWLNPNGSIFASTPQATFHGVSRTGIALLTADGDLDSSFDPGSLFAPNNYFYNYVWGAKYSADQTRVLVFGIIALQIEPPSPESSSGIWTNGIAALHVDGMLDPSFQAPISTIVGPVCDILPDLAGNTYAVGQFQYNFARLRADGSFDPEFTAGFEFAGIVYHILSQPDGRLLLAGDFSSPASYGTSLARFLPNGAQDNSLPFIPGWSTNYRDVALRRDGSIIATSERNSSLVRILPDTGSPAILLSPKTQRRLAGKNILLYVGATGAPDLRFQWYRNNQPILNGNSYCLPILNFGNDSIGDYQVTVSNALESVSSAVATLSLNTAPEISEIPNFVSGGNYLNIPFTVSDAESPPTDLTVSFDLSVQNCSLNFYPIVHNFGDGTFTIAIAPLTAGPPGTFGFMDVTLKASDADDGVNTRPFRVFVRDPYYSEWALQYFTPAEIADPAIGASSADPNHNGVANLLEYVRGASPTGVDHSRDPQFVFSGSPGNQTLTISYFDTIRHDDVIQIVEVSDDLQTWDASFNQLNLISIEPTSDGRTERITLQLASPIQTSTPRKFFRFRAIQVGPP